MHQRENHKKLPGTRLMQMKWGEQERSCMCTLRVILYNYKLVRVHPISCLHYCTHSHHINI